MRGLGSGVGSRTLRPEVMSLDSARRPPQGKHTIRGLLGLTLLAVGLPLAAGSAYAQEAPSERPTVAQELAGRVVDLEVALAAERAEVARLRVQEARLRGVVDDLRLELVDAKRRREDMEASLEGEVRSLRRQTRWGKWKWIVIGAAGGYVAGDLSNLGEP